ncbi:unnamed protein product [Polarella glacialis]|uniref:Uncharacterized protein n=1 Tax=Polarella glacialis TaxID=89957 RepID=A0A813EPD8_POLGL|nr:unnamed protein product [Polarella glacialis]
MASVECEVREAAQSFLRSWSCGEPQSAHPSFVRYEATPSGLVGAADRPLLGDDGSCSVLSVLVLEQGLAAAAHVAYPGHAGWLTLLKGERWLVISAIVSAVVPGAVSPADVGALMGACWDGYCSANRACDGDKMAEIFHPLCRLTFATEEDTIVIMSQEDFVEKVRSRYETPMHRPYAHLRHDPRAAAHDTLLGCSFATADVAMVTLKVGHPPCLWTDLLCCAKLMGRWWIVAKSSCSEPFLAEERAAV